MKAARHPSPTEPPTLGTALRHTGSAARACGHPRKANPPPHLASVSKKSGLHFSSLLLPVCRRVRPLPAASPPTPALPCRAEGRGVGTYVSERCVRSRARPRFLQVLAPVKADFLHARTLFCQKTENRQTKARTSALQGRPGNLTARHETNSGRFGRMSVTSLVTASVCGF